MENKQTLILMTGSYRLDHLLHIAKTININYDEYFNYFNIYWLICKDQYNEYGNIDKTLDYLNKTNINYNIKNSGKPNQPNYGGDLFNIPLQEFIEENQLDNPWVYILDDDNIIHPNLYKIFKICLDNNFYGNKEIITTINKWDLGHNREINKEIYLLQNTQGLIQEWFLFDPSQVILKYNIIQKYGFYSNELLYDYYWLNFPVIASEIENTIWFNEYEYSYGRHVVGTYHNGLVKQEDIEEFLKCDINNLNIDILFSNLNIERPKNIPILSQDIKEKVIQLIKQEISNYE